MRRSLIIEELFFNNRDPNESFGEKRMEEMEECKADDISIQNKLRSIPKSKNSFTRSHTQQDSINEQTLKIDPLEISLPACFTERIHYTDIVKPNLDNTSDIKSELPNCNLCFDLSPDAVLLECGHGGICFRCAKKLLKFKKNCPLCREEVQLVVKIDIKKLHGVFVKVIDSISKPIT